MLSARDQAILNQFKNKYPIGHDYTTPGATYDDFITDLRQMARSVDVSIPDGKIRLFYSGFRDQLVKLTKPQDTRYAIVDNTNASMILNGMDVMMRLEEAVRRDKRFDPKKPDALINQVLSFDTSSPNEIMSARYAEAAKGPITIVTEQAFVTPGDPEKSSILYRTEVKVLLGQATELDGITYRNTDVPEVNGISRETLLGSSGERQLSDSEYNKSFNSIEAISRAEFNILKKAVGDNSAQSDEARKVIEQLGFGDVTQTLGRAADKFLQGDLDKLSNLPSRPDPDNPRFDFTAELLKTLRSGEGFNIDEYQKLTQSFVDHLGTLQRANIDVDENFANQILAEDLAAKRLGRTPTDGGDDDTTGRTNAASEEFDALVEEYKNILDKTVGDNKRISVVEALGIGAEDGPRFSEERLIFQYKEQLKADLASGELDRAGYVEEQFRLMKIKALAFLHYLREPNSYEFNDQLRARLDAGIQGLKDSFNFKGQAIDLVERIANAADVNSLGENLRAIYDFDVPVRAIALKALSITNVAFELIDIELNLAVIEADAVRFGLTEAQIADRQATYFSNLGLQNVASVVLLAPFVFAASAFPPLGIALLVVGSFQGLLGILETAQRIQGTDENGEPLYAELKAFADVALPILKPINDFFLAPLNATFEFLFSALPQVRVTSGGNVDVILPGENVLAIGFDEASIIGIGDQNDWIIHTGFGEVKAGEGDDIILGWKPEAREEGDPLVDEFPDGLKVERDNSLTLDGEKGDDYVIAFGGEGAITIGGEGRDFLFNTSEGGVIYGDTQNGKDVDGNDIAKTDENSDVIWFYPGVTLKDAGPEDFLKFYGLPLTGGNNQFPSYLVAAPGLFATGLGAASDLQTFNSDFYLDRFFPFINYVPVDGGLRIANTFSIFGKLIFGDDSEAAQATLRTDLLDENAGSFLITDYEGVLSQNLRSVHFDFVLSP